MGQQLHVGQGQSSVHGMGGGDGDHLVGAVEKGVRLVRMAQVILVPAQQQLLAPFLAKSGEALPDSGPQVLELPVQNGEPDGLAVGAGGGAAARLQQLLQFLPADLLPGEPADAAAKPHGIQKVFRGNIEAGAVVLHRRGQVRLADGPRGADGHALGAVEAQAAAAGVAAVLPLVDGVDAAVGGAQAAADAGKMGYTCRIGTECEFYLFETDERQAPTLNPFDHGSYCDVSPLDRGENVRREICLSLEEMGMFPESSHHEQGPGQNEIDFKYADALTAADNLIAFKSAVKSIAAINGLYASFMPKPFLDQSGSGLHVNMSLSRGGINLFKERTAGHSAEAESFMAGVLHRAAEITAFLNPLTNSYSRFGCFEAPKYITWSHQNRSQLVRIPAAGGEYTRMELRSPDAACNPYYAFALLIEAGLEGIKARLPLPAPVDMDLFVLEDGCKDGLAALPATLEQAVELAEHSEFVERVIPKRVLHRFCKAKRAEYQKIQSAKNRVQAEHDLYFSLV